jgi:PIN domain
VTRRYLFVFYADLEQLKIEILDQISDRIFLFIAEHVEHVPIARVKALQQLGKSVKWVDLQTDEPDERKVHLSFLLGKLHEKVPTDVEFAILSNSEDYDSIIQYVNRSRRNCVRVCTTNELVGQMAPQNNVSELDTAYDVDFDIAQTALIESPQPITSPATNYAAATTGLVRPNIDESIFVAASKVRERMQRSGNRPAELELLKEYIILSTPNLVPGTAEKVIDILASNRDIDIESHEVRYHF